MQSAIRGFQTVFEGWQAAGHLMFACRRSQKREQKPTNSETGGHSRPLSEGIPLLEKHSSQWRRIGGWASSMLTS